MIKLTSYSRMSADDSCSFGINSRSNNDDVVISSEFFRHSNGENYMKLYFFLSNKKVIPLIKALWEITFFYNKLTWLLLIAFRNTAILALLTIRNSEPSSRRLLILEK